MRLPCNYLPRRLDPFEQANCHDDPGKEKAKRQIPHDLPGLAYVRRPPEDLVAAGGKGEKDEQGEAASTRLGETRACSVVEPE